VYAVFGCIYYHYWHDLSDPAGKLGFPTTDEMTIAGGQVSYFSNGSPCGKTGPNNSTSAIYAGYQGVHSVSGCIYSHYVNDFSGPDGLLGFPIMDELPIAGGQVSYFYKAPACSGGGPYGSSGAIYASLAGGGYEVHGCIYQAYVARGGPASVLGFPTSNEYAITGGRRSNFQHGYIWFENSSGLTRVVLDCSLTGTCM
jgi:uncharacterized protein with LGFP repeats